MNTKKKQTFAIVIATMISINTMVSPITAHALENEPSFITQEIDIETKDEEIAINELNFPDPIFREYVKENYDSNKDNNLSNNEINKATFCDIRGKNITTLKGIEYLTTLEYLWCSQTKISELDVKKNLVLKQLDCTGTNITSLDISNNTSLERLTCSGTKIKNLNINQHKKLKQLYCNSNTNLTNLNIDGASSLEILNCSFTNISVLNLSNNEELLQLDCQNTKISVLDVSNNILLNKLICANTNIASLNVSKNTLLTQLDCRKTSLAWLNIGINNNLVNVNIPTPTLNMNITSDEFDITNEIKGIDVSKISNIQGALISGNIVSNYQYTSPITYSYNCGAINGNPLIMNVILNHTAIAITADNFPDDVFRAYVEEFDSDKNLILSNTEIAKITTLYADGNNGKGAIKSLKGIEYLYALKKLSCYKTQITEINLSNNPNLNYLDCSDTAVNELDLSNNFELEYLAITNTPIKNMNTSNNKNLKTIICTNSRLEAINIDKNTKLEQLYCRNTKISKLDLSHNIKLKYLDCAMTDITELDMSNNLELTDLYCNNSKVQNLNINNNTDLIFLNCSNTELTSLNVKHNLKLIYLYCYKTKIDILDVSNNLELKELNCSNTQINEIDVAKLSKLQKLWTWKTKLQYLNVSNNPNLILLDTPMTNLAYLDFGSTDLKELYKDQSTEVQLVLNSNTFDITKAFKGININKITILSNGSIDKNGIVSSYKIGVPIKYTYNCGTANGQPIILNVTINLPKSDSMITITENLDTNYTGKPIASPSVNKTGSTGNVTFTYEKRNGDTWEKCNNIPINVGKYKVQAHLASDDFYNAAVCEKEFAILKTTNKWIEKPAITDWTYGENANIPSSIPMFGDVTFSYSNLENGIYTEQLPTNVGTWYVKTTVIGTDNYTGLEKILTFAIVPKKVENSNITISDIKNDLDVENIIISDGNKVLIKGIDYNIEKKQSGPTTIVTITFKGNYIGTITRTYTIKKDNPEDETKNVQTDDNIQTDLFTVLNILSAGCIVFLMGKKRKNKIIEH